MSEINAERLAKIYTKIRAKRLELEKEVSELQRARCTNHAYGIRYDFNAHNKKILD